MFYIDPRRCVSFLTKIEEGNEEEKAGRCNYACIWLPLRIKGSFEVQKYKEDKKLTPQDLLVLVFYYSTVLCISSYILYNT